jgi:hypothetical protein
MYAYYKSSVYRTLWDDILQGGRIAYPLLWFGCVGELRCNSTTKEGDIGGTWDDILWSAI